MPLKTLSVWPETTDPLLWLEEVHSPASLSWVEEQNLRTHGAWRDNNAFGDLSNRLAKAYLPHDKPVIPSRERDWAYDFRTDEKNPRGLWRRTKWEAWRQGKADWQDLLDFDALVEAESKPWVCAGITLLYPDGDRALISLSPGGADAVTVREFDMTNRCFVADGFTIEAAGKHTISWIDRDTVYLGWDDGSTSDGADGGNASAALTHSGYPREVRQWRRGTPISEAAVIFSGETSDISVSGHYDAVEHRHTIHRGIDFFDGLTYRESQGDWLAYDLPFHVALNHWQGWLLLQPRLDWNDNGVSYSGGSLLAIREDVFLSGGRRLFVLFAPTSHTSDCSLDITSRYLIGSWLEDVQSRSVVWEPLTDAEGNWHWNKRQFPGKDVSQVSLSAVDYRLNDEVFVRVDDYLSPPRYYWADLASDDLTKWTLLAQWPTQFDATLLSARRGLAQSADGTWVPYALIGPATPPNTAANGVNRGAPAPCLLSAYGGFSIPLLPGYDPGLGIGWLEQGGIAVVANIRGGGEFGSRWHTAALRQSRQRAFDDFIAVAEKLIADGLTTAEQLGINGGSNGGLLVGACMTQRPELFGAVVCEVPLLDMQRYNLLHAGASWMEEYGDPADPDDAKALAAYSPYHHVSHGIVYPPVLFMTSTSDDRVHPGHARKMVARLQSLGHANAWLWEKTDGGHGSADANEAATSDALKFRFLWEQLGYK